MSIGVEKPSFEGAGKSCENREYNRPESNSSETREEFRLVGILPGKSRLS
jgi:hypothetical protein